MDRQQIPARKGIYNLQNYEELRKNFSWEDVNKNFSWHKTKKVNIAYEAVDRHAENPTKKDKVALIYSASDREEKVTFHEMSKQSNQFANILKKYGVEKGDRIFLFLPRSREFYTSFFGILKIGAIAGPLYEAFMEQAIRDRLLDSEAKMLITTPNLLERVPQEDLPNLEKIILIGENSEYEEKYIDYKQEMALASTEFDMEWLDLEDGMFIHYTSGLTEKPKGIYHVQQAMIQHYQTGKWVLDLKEDDVYWCTADPGWITGTSYGILTPWLHGVTNVIKDGHFNPEDWYKTLEEYQVSVWYTEPTDLRMLLSVGDELVKKSNLSSLRHLLSVGEPLSPEVITWGLKVLNIRIHDTWWMTETGAQLIVNLPTEDIRPGSIGKPIPGIEATIVDHEGNELPPNEMGNLAIKAGWPAMMRAVWNNPSAYESYFMNGWYVSGDLAYRDEDGYFWIQGRLDGVLKTSQERVGPYEIESKLMEHPAVAEAVVIGKPHPEQGEIMKALITLNDGVVESPKLLAEIRQHVTSELSAHAAPHELEVRDTIPKTRSGKIMRHLLSSQEFDSSTV